MLDLVGIVFSSLMMLVVIVRAVQLDSTRPWFERPEPEAADAASDELGRGRRPGRPAPARAGEVRLARARGRRG